MGLSGRQDHQPGIVLEFGEPALNVGSTGVDGLVGNAGHTTQKGGAHFGNKFFLAVVRATEGAEVGEGLSVQSLPVAGAVGQFMKEHGVVMFDFGEEPRSGHVDGVLDWGVVRPGFGMGDRGTVGHVSEDLLTASKLLRWLRALGLDL